MSLNLELLTLLKGGKICSGEMLGDALGISRAAVWKQLEKLRAVGIDVESVRGKGYRIPGGIELLESDEIQRQLPVRISDQLKGIHVAEELDSTNTWLKEQADYLRDRQVCLAERQTAGRGCRGRHWVSPFGCNLYLSLAWGFEGGIKALEGLSLAVAVAVCRALEPGAPRGTITLKWPNDICMTGENGSLQKLGGILIETSASMNDRVIIGIGLNLNRSPTLNDTSSTPPVSLGEMLGRSVRRDDMLSAVVTSVLEAIDALPQDCSELLTEYRGRCALRGKDLSLKQADRLINGRCIGIADDGSLELLVDGAA